MSLSLLLQYTIVSLAVVASAWVVATKQFPGSVRRLRVAIALNLLREGRAPWLHALGRWISPVAKAADSACGGCNNCGPEPPRH